MTKGHTKKRPYSRRTIRIGKMFTASTMERAQATKTVPEAQFKQYRHLDVKLWRWNSNDAPEM